MHGKNWRRGNASSERSCISTRHYAQCQEGTMFAQLLQCSYVQQPWTLARTYAVESAVIDCSLFVP